MHGIILINNNCLSLLALVSVQINDSTSTSLIVGQNYTLTCRVHGTDSTVTAYQWMKNGTLLSNEMQATLSFSSIRLSDAGQYTCEVTVKSMKYSTVEEITIASKNVKTVGASNLVTYMCHLFISSFSNICESHKCSTQPNSTCWICCYFNLYCGIESYGGFSSDCDHIMDCTSRTYDN